jgi:uncharacterized membrane protein HdeD (DUF308 family)
MQQTNTRLWWMEVLRGIVAISFGLMSIFIDVRFFIYTIGFYLIIDGSLDTYKIAKGKRVSNRRALSYLGSTLSILLGLICFVFHLSELFSMRGNRVIGMQVSSGSMVHCWVFTSWHLLSFHRRRCTLSYTCSLPS